jgi:hypothetical protein
MATALDPRWLGQVVELKPADHSNGRTLARPDAPVAAPAVPDENAQEIVFSPPGSPKDAPPLRIFFDTDADDLADKLQAVSETVYVLSGRRGWQEFERALNGTVREVFGGVTAPVAVQGESIYRNPDETPKRHKLITLYPRVLRVLADRIDELIPTIGPAAARWAALELQKQREEIVGEAFRYLLVSDSERTGNDDQRRQAISRHLASTPWGVDISGPEAAGLIGALREVRAPRDALRTYRTNVVITQVVRRIVLGNQLVEATRNPAAIALVPFLPVTTPEEDQANIDIRVGIAADVARIAAPHQIVHRLWATGAVDLVQLEEARNPRATNDEIARRLSVVRAYREAVGQALKDTLDATSGMKEELEDDPDTVWAYPRAVRVALTAQGVPRGSLTWAAAEERLAREQESAVSKVNEVVGYCQMLALAGGVSAPGAAVLEAVSLVLNTIELGEGIWKAWHESRASKTHLNPGKSFASDPSYAAILLGVLNVGLSALGVRGSLK